MSAVACLLGILPTKSSKPRSSTIARKVGLKPYCSPGGFLCTKTTKGSLKHAVLDGTWTVLVHRPPHTYHYTTNVKSMMLGASSNASRTKYCVQ